MASLAVQLVSAAPPRYYDDMRFLRLCFGLVLLAVLFYSSLALAGPYIRKHGSIVGELDGNYLRKNGSIVAEFDGRYVRKSGSIHAEFDGHYIRKNGSIHAEIDGRYVRKNGSIVWEIESNGYVRKDGSIVYQIDGYSDSEEMKQRVAAYLLFFAD